MKFESVKTAYVFPGQGTQFVGMGKELAAQFDLARRVFQEADEILRFSLSHLMWEGPESDLNDTVNTQPALYVHSMAALQVLAAHLPDLAPDCAAGHSLGELTALAASGALTFADGLRLVRRRGELMKRAGEIAPGGMAAILGLDISTLEQICTKASHDGEIVQVANDNCPGQTVISGAKPALERALEAAKTAGARRAIPLAVSIAAHSPLMISVQSEFETAVNAALISPPIVPVVSNVTARPLNTVEDIRADLTAQLNARVRWTESVQWMLTQGVQTFVEIGAGSVLTGLLKRIEPTATGLCFGAPADFTHFL